MSALSSLGAIALGLFVELVAPSGCCACDERVAPHVLFCVACAATVQRAEPSGRAGGHAAVFEYGGATATAIARLKYHDRPDLARRLGASMIRAAGALPEVDAVVPVPLHPRRLAERGYNQAALLSTPIARALGVPLAARALARVDDTPQQVTLDRAARLVNLERAFAARARQRLEGARVLLVDDVRTTGATLDACARALTRGGALDVTSLVLAIRA